MISAYLLPHVGVDTFVTALVLAVVLGVFNVLLRPVLLILTFPVTVLTLGLFAFVVNASLIWLAKYVVPGFSVGNFGWALLFAMVLSLVNMAFRHMGRSK